MGPWDLLLEKHIYIFFIPLSVGPWDSLVGEAYLMNVLKFSDYIVINIHGTFRHSKGGWFVQY